MPPPTPPTPPPPIAGWPDRRIADLAGRQRATITRAQLRELDISTDAIDRALRRGRLQRVHHGVYSLLPPRARPPFAAEQAALLACGPHAVLSYESAAQLHGLRLPTRAPVPHVTTVGPHRRRRPGIEVHTTMPLHRSEHRRVDGLDVTSVARTLLDLAPHLRDRQLAPVVDQALRLTSRTKLREAIARRPQRPGARRLARLLEPGRPSQETWSRGEARLRRTIERAGLPAPESNVALGRYVADLLWREQRVIVEYDSEAFHTGPHVFDHDRTRHNDLAAHGRYEILHVTERHLREELERVIVWIALALDHSDHI